MKIIHIADILAIPFFLLTFFYFYNIKNKYTLEFVLMLFAFSGFIIDSIFTYNYWVELSKATFSGSSGIVVE
jgi:hypothetical protein